MNASVIGIADFNRDGVEDVISGATSGGTGSIYLAKTSDGIAPLIGFSLTSIADARQALPLLESKRELLLAQRAEIGASMARLEFTKTALNTRIEAFQAAESRIRDADIAQEAANLTRLQIQQQAATAVLAQANQQPALLLNLLR